MENIELVDNSRYTSFINYHFNRTNQDLINNITFIFVFLQNYTLFYLHSTFMNDLYLKKWDKIKIHINNLIKIKNDYHFFQPLLELNGIIYLSLEDMYEIL